MVETLLKMQGSVDRGRLRSISKDIWDSFIKAYKYNPWGGNVNHV